MEYLSKVQQSNLLHKMTFNRRHNLLQTRLDRKNSIKQNVMSHSLPNQFLNILLKVWLPRAIRDSVLSSQLWRSTACFNPTQQVRDHCSLVWTSACDCVIRYRSFHIFLSYQIKCNQILRFYQFWFYMLIAWSNFVELPICQLMKSCPNIALINRSFCVH